jgi:hypothetical protein
VTFDELLGVVVADLAGIPTAPFALVEVPADLLAVESGEYFGSYILGDHTPLDPSYVSPGLSDEALDELCYLMAFDLLIVNNDRKFPDILRRGSEQLIPVDHGNALSGANWTAEHLGKCLESGIATARG